jgi:hypothetical protein
MQDVGEATRNCHRDKHNYDADNQQILKRVLRAVVKDVRTTPAWT